MKKKLLIILFSLLIITSCKPQTNLDLINLPENFKIEIYADNVENARSMTYADDVLYVGTRTVGKVYAIINKEVNIIAENLNSPNGVAYKDGDLYVAEIDRILKFPNVKQNLENPQYEIVYDQLPKETNHGWKYLKFGPDNKLYFQVGAPCNICEIEDPYATILALDLENKELEIIARGVRNTVGFDWNPIDDKLWFTNNGRDWMGEDLPPDSLHVIEGAQPHFGFPYCHAGTPDPDFTERKCDEFFQPTIKLDAHVAPLGMHFYTGNQFPEEYKNNIFIAEHGSWNRIIPVGYKIIRVDLNNDPPKKSVFADGWLQNGKSWGRPVDIEILPDGSMLISDDKAGKIYRIYY